MIIDFHTHIFHEKVVEKAVSQISEFAKISVFSDGTLQGLEKSMRESGVDISVICNIATNKEQTLSLFEWCNTFKLDKIIPLMSMHPENENKPALVKMFKEKGYKGFKMHPYYQNFYIDDKKMYEFYEAIIDSGMFIIFHAGKDISTKPPFHVTPERLLKLINDLPELKIVAAHMGGYQMYNEVEEYLFGKDIYFDTSYNLDKLPENLLKKYFSKHPIERFLFATDSPWCDQKGFVEFFKSIKFLNDDTKEKIFYENAKTLLKL